MASGKNFIVASWQHRQRPLKLHCSPGRAPTQHRRLRRSSIATSTELQRSIDDSDEASLQLRRISIATLTELQCSTDGSGEAHCNSDEAPLRRRCRDEAVTPAPRVAAVHQRLQHRTFCKRVLPFPCCSEAGVAGEDTTLLATRWTPRCLHTAATQHDGCLQQALPTRMTRCKRRPLQRRRMQLVAVAATSICSIVHRQPSIGAA